MRNELLALALIVPCLRNELLALVMDEGDHQISTEELLAPVLLEEFFPFREMNYFHPSQVGNERNPLFDEGEWNGRECAD